MTVVLTEEAQADFVGLPVTIQIRVREIFATRLPAWPTTSGAKPMRGALKGHFRIRTSDWRVIFKVSKMEIVVMRIAHRSTVYDD